MQVIIHSVILLCYKTLVCVTVTWVLQGTDSMSSTLHVRISQLYMYARNVCGFMHSILAQTHTMCMMYIQYEPGYFIQHLLHMNGCI